MFKEIKIYERYWSEPEPEKCKTEEVLNANNKLGSEELANLNPKYKHLINTDFYSFECRKYTNVTITVRTYLFSSLKKHQI